MEELAIRKKEELDPQEKSFRRRKDIIKNIIIVFLVVMLVLTFFSNTIMNYSLPKVAVQYVEPGTITQLVRGEGTVESGDPYNVMVKYVKTVGSINVKVGQEVKEGDLLLTLKAEDSEELTAAKKALADAKKAYDTALLSDKVDAAIIASSKGSFDIDSYRAKISAAQTDITLAEKAVEDKQKTVTALENQISITSGSSVSEAEKTQVANLLTASDNAKTALDDAKEALDTANTALTAAQNALSAAQNEKANALASLTSAQEDHQSLLNDKTALETAFANKAADPNYVYTDAEQTLVNTYGNDLSVINNMITNALSAVNTAQATYDDAVADEPAKIAAAQADVNSAQAAVTAATTARDSAQTTYNNAYSAWKTANDAITNKTNSNSDSLTNLNNQLNQAKVALSDAQNNLTSKQAELTAIVADIGSVRELNEAQEAIAEAQKEVDKYSEESGASEVYAPINGTILNINVQSGKKTTTDDAAVVIQPEGQGYLMKFSLDNDKAKTVSIGDTAEVTNSWWYEDVTGSVATIRPDPSDPSRKKEITLNLNGSLTTGQSLTMTISSRTANYDSIVPSSAVREDNKGKFVLVVESKSSPLGNRYYAVRYDVDVLASDDTKTAVSGALSGYEYVVTTSSKPIEPGAEVRLSEN
ncbi:MAG: HlyD family efflux transporter periplasmic adaptor subunit [Lachnospiraceae bacterium]|nr:HlyD family efflux transporter periplasmic adaptor subunit [Lachnospiraceae bacterium]